MRLDKWLWAARFFKTRSQAARACETGRIEVNGARAKPAREMHAGDRLRIETEAGEFVVTAAALSGIRGPASVARTLYVEAEEDRQRRLEAEAAARAARVASPHSIGRPGKRDRRRITRFLGGR